MSKKPKRIVVIGGGASGMVAAIAAARRGVRVQMVERMSRVGKKLLATGNGRCNLTNTDLAVSHYHGGVSWFVEGVLNRFGLDATLGFFKNIGLATRVEDEGKVFPLSGQASSVLDLLRYEMEQAGVEEVCDRNIQRIEGQNGRLRCFCTDGTELHSDRVIVATGGKSAPNMGSNGGGFKIAAALGHTIVEPSPALVQLNLSALFLKALKGLKVEGAAQVLVGGKPGPSASGELLFTEYGISGPPILAVSRAVSRADLTYLATVLRLDLFPELSERDLTATFADRFALAPRKALEFSLVGFLHKRLIRVVPKQAGLDMGQACSDLPTEAAGTLSRALKQWDIRCTGTQSWMHSQVTAGGVALDEVNAQTMESLVAPGVYFTGEVLDVDGDCGGYNLQWAWATGHIAGEEAAR